MPPAPSESRDSTLLQQYGVLLEGGAMSEMLQGRAVSLWLATAAGTGYPSLRTDLDVDIAVIGGGVAGLTAALALKRAGQSVAVIEAARVGTGVTGHTTGKVTSLHRLVYTELAGRHGPDTARRYGQANQAAVEHIARVVSDEGIDCGFRRVPNFTYAETDEALDLVRGEAALAARLGLPSAFTEDVPLPFAVKGAVRFDNQVQIHAVRYVQGLARAVDGGGSFVFEESRALALRDGSPAVVETERGSLRARDVIVATNVPFGDQGSFAERSILHRSYVVASRAGSPQLEGTYISVDEPMRSILAVEIDGASYVLAGGEGHRPEDSGDTAERYRRLTAFSRDRLGTSEPVFRWSTQDSISVDGLPYVGLMSPNSAHIHVITGLRKWGTHQRLRRGPDPGRHLVRPGESVGAYFRQHPDATGRGHGARAPERFNSARATAGSAGSGRQECAPASCPRGRHSHRTGRREDRRLC